MAGEPLEDVDDERDGSHRVRDHAYHYCAEDFLRAPRDPVFRFDVGSRHPVGDAATKWDREDFRDALHVEEGAELEHRASAPIEDECDWRDRAPQPGRPGALEDAVEPSARHRPAR